MVLAVDIGNTSISFGLLRGQRVIQNFWVETNLPYPQLHLRLKKFFYKIKEEAIEQIVICSVVPFAMRMVVSLVKQYLKQRPVVVGQDVHVPIKNNYRNPKQVGQDRLVGAFAVKSLYGFPAIIIDFGTAITFDVVSSKGEYEGGIILPGIRLSAESLFQKTTLLPQIEKIKAPHSLIGRNTKASILSGLFYGYGAMSCGLIDLISQQIKGRPKVIVTGGYTNLMKKFIAKKIDKIDKFIVFKGLYLLSKEGFSPNYC